MSQLHQYPVICTDRLVESVNFYEDHFDFIPEIQMEEYVLLRHQDNKDRYIAFIDVTCPILPTEAQKVTSGLIISFPVKNVDAAYQQAYWEGLDIVDEPKPALCGRKHFLVKDPNGIYIDVMQKEIVKEEYLVAA